MVILEQIRNNLIEAIKDSGLSQTEIARRLNIKQQTVQQYVSGRAMPALDTFANLCIVLDVDPADILCTSNYNKPIFEHSSISGSIFSEMKKNGKIKF